MNPDSNAYKILAILQSHAPNGPAQERCTREFNKLIRENRSELDTERLMVSQLYDGLAYGNWPWGMRQNADHR